MELVQVIPPLFLVWLAWRSRDTFLLIVTCPVAITFGLAWWTAYKTPEAMALALVVAALGLYMLVLAINNIVK